MAAHGPKLIEVLTRIWQQPATFRCDFARAHAGSIAIAATHGLITCHDTHGTFCHVWLVTVKGLRFIHRRQK